MHTNKPGKLAQREEEST